MGIHNTYTKTTPVAHRQRGAVLMMSLAVLLILTLIGLTSLNTTALEEKMAGNMADKNVAFHAAETALRAAETMLDEVWLPALDTLSPRNETCSNQGCVFLLGEKTPASFSVSDWASFGTPYTGSLQGIARQPLYFIEYRQGVSTDKMVGQQPSEEHFFQITAIGFGNTENAQVVLRSTYMERLN